MPTSLLFATCRSDFFHFGHVPNRPQLDATLKPLEQNGELVFD